MNKRTEKILKATIHNYIETAEPVSSNKLIKKYGFELSPATVRNELNELVKGGYLAQLHTSSGRAPTDKGYRIYVDSLMDFKGLPKDQKKMIVRRMKHIGLNIRDILTNTSALMSSLVNYTAFVLTPDIYEESLKVAHLILLDLNKVLLVLLDSLGVNKEFVIKFEHKASQEDLNKISKLLTEKLKGKSFSEIDEEVFGTLVAELPAFKVIILRLCEEIKKITKAQKKQTKLLMSGVSKMLKLPEFKNIELTHKVISTLEESKVLSNVLQEYLATSFNPVVIGKENKIDNLKDCSVVLSPCMLNKRNIGALGLLGPKRMKYSQIVPMVLEITKMANEYINDVK
ncbi:heat-inducible transcriptional repressor HrcA [Candidatus Margulisiibacteriota bacterium]